MLNSSGYGWSSHVSWLFFALSFLLFSPFCSSDSNQCAPGLNTAGRTWPQGDIVLEYGQSLKIYCILNEILTDPKYHGKNASDLALFRNDKEMEPEYIKVVNKTTIMMYVDKPAASKAMYYCKLKFTNGNNKSYEPVCLNKVVVGYKPQKPSNFSCISRNWENLTCSWTPVPNDIATRFFLRYWIPRQDPSTYSCPVPKQEHKLPPNTCMWEASTDPPYRNVHKNYTFILRAENVLGNNSFTYHIRHFAHVIPAKPVNLSVVDKTYSSAMLHWSVPFAMRGFPPGLVHRIQYQNQWDDERIWETMNITDNAHANEKYYNLTGLKYANAVYDVRVSIKSFEAIEEDKWGQYSGVTFKTAPTLPGQPPKTDVGSFEIAGNSGNRDVYIYWQTIPAWLENGDNFTYQVVHVEENGRSVDLQPHETTKTYAKFKAISFNSFRFEIVTTNCRGANRQKAVVHVPSQFEMPREPVAFTKIAFDGGLYELSWNLPSGNSNVNITNYTIFWCENDRDRPYQCSGYLDWIHVSRNTSIYNTTVPDPKKVYQFAIAANTERASSGMVWASCTAIHNKVVGKMKSVWINHIDSKQIEVGWKLECSDRIDIVQGFNIYYCPIASPYNSSCKDPKMNTTVKADPHTIHGIVQGLKPYTTYMLTVAVLTKNGEGQHSDPLYNTTLEAAPTPPRDVLVRNVTNTTMTVQWQEPSAKNGVLRYYNVHYNKKTINAEKATTIEIKNLEPHTGYNVTVSACTISCGEPSDFKFVRTDIGIPGKIDVPVVRFSNSSQVRILWNPPKDPAGYLDYYEILTADGHIHSNITSTDQHLAIPDCTNVGHDNLYRFQVRAVNLGSDKSRLQGPWSEPGEGHCYNNGPSTMAWIVIWVIGALGGVVFLLFIGYLSKRLWLKCKAMQDVEVKLPPGLASNVKLLEKGHEQHTQQLSADSSGCSSGQESVTSSLTSDSHVLTDSGADLDPVPMSPTKLLETPPTWESCNLRQRNVAGTTKPDSSCGERVRRDPYVMVAKNVDTISGESLSLARSTPNLTAVSVKSESAGTGLYTASQQQHTWSSAGYISMPSSEEESLSEDPSLLPIGKGNGAQGIYSVVGLPPSLMPRSKAETRGPDTSHPHAAKLIPLGTESKPTPGAVPNPYVSLAFLEQKSRIPITNTHVPSSVDDFTDDNLEFSRSVREQHTPPPFSISDKLTKPYVQTGILDATKKMSRPIAQRDALTASATEMSGGPSISSSNCVEPEHSTSQSLMQISSNVYLPIDAARGGGTPASKNWNETSAYTQSPYVAVSKVSIAETPARLMGLRVRTGLEIDDGHMQSSNPFIPTSEIPETSPNIPTTRKSDCQPDGFDRSLTSVAVPLPVVTQTLGYVSIAENSPRTGNGTSLENSTLPYQPHQRVNKKSTTSSPQNVGQGEEQYSKVTAVPTTT
ncbi:cytokine receptor [Athalia rosae]|uniref:cytokine receptor n=1 Tax=Athalia rosae TaxID=37344 RepID=UPI002033A1FD|nr:cytokine receptor [Athalia rosae]